MTIIDEKDLFIDDNSANRSYNEASDLIKLPIMIVNDKTSNFLTANIQKINSIGDVTIKFNRDVMIPRYFKLFSQNNVLEVSIMSKS